MSAGRLPLRASLRFYRQHPLQLALTLLGIALGAAVIVAVSLATRAATVSFDRSLDALAGPTTHEIRAREGVLDERLYRWLRLERGLRASLPVVTAQLTLGGRSVDLVGIDPLAMPGDGSAPAALTNELAALLTEPGAIIAPADLARRAGLAAGVAATASVGERSARLLPLAVFNAAAGDWFADALLADIATVQDLAGRRGELDRIQLRLTPGEEAALRRALPATVALRAYDDRRQTFDDMTRAFRTNLTAMSLLAVLVGAFLVYNAMTFAVVQRAPTFAVLRMIGATPRQLFRRLLLEATVLGLIGGLVGLALGIVLGQSLLLLVTRTVSDLYVAIEPTRPDIAPARLAAALAVTLGAVLVATLAPARAAAAVAPAILEHASSARDRWGRRAGSLLGTLLVLACPLLIALSGDSLLVGFVALFLLITGYALLCPLLLRGALAGLLRGPGRRGGARLQLVLRGVDSALPRTAPAIIALAVAVSATVGVAIMIGSFRASVADWLDTTLQGDLYVYREGSGAGLPPAWVERASGLPGVAAVSAARQRRLRLDGEELRVLVLDEDAVATRSFHLVAGDDEAITRVLRSGEGLLISEPLANRRRLALNDRVQLATPDGVRALTVRGVYRDFASSYGAAVLPLATYDRHWQDRDISTLAVTLAPGADGDALREGLLALGRDDGLTLTVRSNEAISERSLAIFDRTFVITDVLRALVVLVAFVGIVSALMALFLERRREFAILRATGMTPRQLLALVLMQASTSGLLAGLLALPLGAALSVLLIDVINRRSFGWTLATHLDPVVAVHALVLAVAAAALAALWPARRLAGGSLRAALHAP